MLDWHTGEEAWQQPVLRSEERPRKPSRRPLLVRVALLFLIGVVAAILWASQELPSVVDVSRLIPGPPRPEASAPTQAPSSIPVLTPDPTHEAIQAALDQETEAWCTGNLAAYQTLLDPQASTDWREQRVKLFEEPSTRCPQALKATRVAVAGEWAVAAVLVSGERFYVLRYFHHLGPEGWKLTAPTIEPWGAPKTLRLEAVRFRHFRRRVLRAAGPGTAGAGPLRRRRLAGGRAAGLWRRSRAL